MSHEGRLCPASPAPAFPGISRPHRPWSSGRVSLWDLHAMTPGLCHPQVVELGILDKLPAEERKRQEVGGGPGAWTCF